MSEITNETGKQGKPSSKPSYANRALFWVSGKHCHTTDFVPFAPVTVLDQCQNWNYWAKKTVRTTFASMRSQSASVIDIMTLSSRRNTRRLASRLRSISLKNPLMSKCSDFTIRSVIVFNWSHTITQSPVYHREQTQQPTTVQTMFQQKATIPKISQV